MRTTATHTYAVLDISSSAYREVRQKLDRAAYQHAFHGEPDGEVIDMHGIGLRADQSQVGPVYESDLSIRLAAHAVALERTTTSNFDQQLAALLREAASALDTRNHSGR